MKKYFFAITTALVFAGCVERLELEPDIEGIITAMEVKGQTRSSANASMRTVNIEVAHDVDLSSVEVTSLTLVDTASADIHVGDVLNLSSPLKVVVSTIASYEWTIAATKAAPPEGPGDPVGRALPGGDFEQWCRTDVLGNPDPTVGRIVWNPWPAAAVWEVDQWWDTGNKGVAFLADSNSTPTEAGEGCPANPEGRAARLESTWAGIKAAGGNIYFGRFGEFNGMDATCHLGHNWQDKPRALKGWYKYFPQPIDEANDAHVAIHPWGLSKNEWIGSPDSLHVCVALWASPDGRDIPFTVDTNINSFVDFSRDADGVLAYGSFVSAEEQASWDEFSVEMEYFTDGELPANTQLYLLITASKNCNYFIAGTGRRTGTGSLMYVDEVELVYD